MKNIRLTIKRKILGSFAILMILFLSNAVFNIAFLSKTETETNRLTELIQPTMLKLSEWQLIVNKSNSLTSSWIKNDMEDHPDKKSLKTLHARTWPGLKKDINTLKNNWENKKIKSQIDQLIKEYEPIIEKQKNVTNTLVKFDDYQDILKKMEVEEQGDAIKAQTSEINNSLNDVMLDIRQKAEGARQDMISAYQWLKMGTITLTLVLLASGILISIIMANAITKPIERIKKVIKELGKGILPESHVKVKQKDEIGEMSGAVNKLIDGIKDTTQFAENIGNGKLDEEYEPLSDGDVLGNALIDMRDNLKKFAEEDKKRNWTNEGFAHFSNLLRNQTNDMKEFGYSLISEIVKYLGANQGGMFIVQEEGDKEFLELMACYAYDRQKFVDRRLEWGEGLVGQCWQEKETIYMTDVPDNYVNITSGLGHANPRCLIIVPLKVNDEVYGILELASFQEFEEHERSFIEKLAENIASAVSSVKVNEKTKKLLQQSQEQAEDLRSQEEEMRQNMEELQSTQEEISRISAEAQGQINAISAVIGTVEMDTNGKVITANAKTTKLIGKAEDVLMGSKIESVLPEVQKYSDQYFDMKAKSLKGQVAESAFEWKVGGKEERVKLVFSPVKNQSGEVLKVLVIIYEMVEETEVVDN